MSRKSCIGKIFLLSIHIHSLNGDTSNSENFLSTLPGDEDLQERVPVTLWSLSWLRIFVYPLTEDLLSDFWADLESSRYLSWDSLRCFFLSETTCSLISLIMSEGLTLRRDFFLLLALGDWNLLLFPPLPLPRSPTTDFLSTSTIYSLRDRFLSSLLSL